MKEQIHTIPIHDAMTNAGECPFCYIERKTEEHALDFTIGHGASYMEADIREMTDKEGFCRAHYKKLFDYGNALGNAWMLKTLCLRYMEEFDMQIKSFKPESNKKGLFSKKSGTATSSDNEIVNWIQSREETCFVCKMVENTFHSYMKTFFELYKKESSFKDSVKASKGFCFNHFKILLSYADDNLKDKDLEEFYNFILPLQKENLTRIYDDISWFVEKFDYKNKDADWKNSKDAVQRTMQKIKGQDPSLPVYVMKK